MHKLISLLLSATLFLALSAGTAVAHDPKEHAAESADPDCAAMKNMDVSKKDKNDAVMKAMLQKCQQAMHEHNHSEEHSASHSNAHADKHK